MEIVRSKMLVVFIILILGIVSISCLNNRRLEHSSTHINIEAK